MWQALQMDKITGDFQQVTEQIEEAMTQIPYDKLDISEEVREQVFRSNLSETCNSVDKTCYWIHGFNLEGLANG